MKSLRFHDALEDCSRLAGKVPQAACLPSGQIPVVGQGKQPAEGFTNDFGLAFRGDLPVILFGDHTASFKFIEYPFARGADGTKLFRPRTDDLDPKYAWHYLQTVRLPQTGYDRKTKYLEDIEIPIPPLEEQRRIAAILDKASALEARSEERMRLVKSLGLARLEQLLVDNEQALAPHRLEDICHGAPITYGILQPGPDIEGGVPYVRPSEIKNSQIDVSRVRRTSAEIAERNRKSALQAGDILFTIVGTIGEVAIVPPELEGANITQSSCRLRVNSSVANSFFVYYSLRTQHVKRQIDRDRLGVAVERLNLHHVRDMEILSLPRPVQELFAAEVQKLGSLASLWMLSTAKVSAVSMALKSSLLENR